jgi:hypothetical protein
MAAARGSRDSRLAHEDLGAPQTLLYTVRALLTRPGKGDER